MVIHYVEQTSRASSSHRSPTPEPNVPEEDAHEHTASETSDPESSSSCPSTPDKAALEPAQPKYTPRADRLNQKVTKGNAQGLFLPSSCVFVGNLSVKVPIQRLEDDLTSLISAFGPCHVKIKIANDRKLPVGFVQFEDVKCAKSALKQNGHLILHNRVLRLELSNCKRTAIFGIHGDTPISREDIVSTLKPHGALENITISHFTHAEGYESTFGIVTFAYPDDFADALQHFQTNRKYYLIRAMESKDGPLPPDFLAAGHRPSNQHPPTRGNHQRYNGNRRGFHRPWYSGGGSNGRGGFRNAPGGPPRQNPSFSNNGQNQPFNGQGHAPQGSFSQNYPGGNNFPQSYVGNNFNQGYPNPMFNQQFPGNNIPQNYQGNNFPPNYPNPNFVSQAVFPNPPMMFNQMPMADGPPPPYATEYTAMPHPGFPIYQQFQPPSTLPPIVTQPQAVPGPVPQRRRQPRPDAPLIVSSQPQFDTEEHRQLYYEPYPSEAFMGMQPAWVGYPGGEYMQQGYVPPYSPCAGYNVSRHSSMENHRNPDSPSRGGASESTLTQTKIDHEDAERGRQMTRSGHITTDGSSDMAPVAVSTQTNDQPIPTQVASGVEETVKDTDAAKATESDIEPAVSVDEPQSHESQHEHTEPENKPNEPQPEPTGAAVPDQKSEELGAGTEDSLQVDTKRAESTGSSEPGRKTPDTDESRERASTQTPAPDVSAKSSETRTTDTTETVRPTENVTPTKGKQRAPATPDTTETLKPVEEGTPDKGKGQVLTTPTPTKTGKRLEPAVPDDKHLLARHRFQHRKPLKKKYQPKTDTGKTVEQYTRELNAQRAAIDPDSRVPEHLLQEVIQELENERRDNARKSRGLGPSDKSSTASGTSSKK